ncbi:serine/arginine repetitive matrix protein 2-like isoform X1 [Amphibalanus amphitrite]|uniref:serine/arginine repetitive matrix protein 2-like isoform X1 n=1 Tax=Amphibalanus amphitrite TaxID=1232801 RepID=UPI001C91FFF4|nr:serine/arginine repetitive matrix protein 2-like isoform X1 [Amphibalanus amphitrite]
MTYTSLPRAKIEYCPETETGSSRSNIRGRGAGAGLREERCSSPKPPIHPGGKSRPGVKSAASTRRTAGTGTLRNGSPAARDTESTANGRTKTAAQTDRRPGLTIDTRNKPTRRETANSPRPATENGARPGRGAPSPGSSARSTPNSCPISPQSSLSPSSPRDSPRSFRFSGNKYSSGIPTRRSNGADSVGGTESPTSGSSINLSDISGLSALTSPESSTNGGPTQSSASRNGRKLQKPSEQPTARNGAATAAPALSKNTSKTWIGSERRGGSVGSPLCRSQESVASGVGSDSAPASRTASQSSLHEPGRLRRPRATPGRLDAGKFGSRSITTIRARNLSKGSSGEREKENEPRQTAAGRAGKLTDATSTKTTNKNGLNSVPDTRSKAAPTEKGTGTGSDTPANKSKVKVQRSLSLQSAAKPSLPPKPSHLRPPAALGAGRPDPLTSLPNIQGLGTDTWRPADNDTWPSRAEQQRSSRAEAGSEPSRRLGSSSSRRAGRAASRAAPDDNRDGRARDASPSAPPSAPAERHSSSVERRRRPDTSNVPAYKNRRDPAPRPDPTFRSEDETLSAEGRQRSGVQQLGSIHSPSDREPESEPGRSREPEPEPARPLYRQSPDGRRSSGAGSLTSRDTDTCSDSGSICLPVPTPPRKQSVDKAVYSSVIHVNGTEDGLVTNRTRLQRYVDAGEQVQATIQGQKDAQNENKVRLSLNVDGDFLNNQFDAIIETLKQVAASVQEQGSRPASVAMTSRNSDPIYAEIRSPRTPVGALSPEPIYSEVRSPVPVRPGSTPTSPTRAPPLPPPVTPRTQAENDAFFDSSPTLDELARKLHADARHLDDDCDYVNFHDLESPYRTPPPVAPQASQLIAGRRGADATPHPDYGSLPYSRNLESVQECSENGSRPDSRDGPASFERLQREAKKALSRSLSDKGAPPRPALSVYRAGSECGDDSARFGTRGELGAPRSERSSCQFLDSDGSVFSSTSDVWTGRDLESAIHTLVGGGLGKTRTRSTGSETAAEPRKPKIKESTSSSFLSRDSKLRGFVRNGWRVGTRRSHSSSDDCRDSTITIDDFIASLYGQQGVSLEALGPHAPTETRNRSESERRAPTAPSASTASTSSTHTRGRNARSNSITGTEPGGSRGRPPSDEPQMEEEGFGRDSPVPQQRSLSLPKTFLAERYGLAGFKAAIPSVLFPWRRGDSNRASGRSSVGDPDTAEDTRSVSSAKMDGSTGAERRRPGVNKTQRQLKTSSSPVLSGRRGSTSNSEWDVRRTWSLYGDQDADMLSANSEASVSPLPPDEEMVTGPRSLQTNPGAPSPTPSSESVLQKFRKSFSLRFYKRGVASADPAAPSRGRPPAAGRPDEDDDEDDCDDCEDCDEDDGGPRAGGAQGRRADRSVERADCAAGEDDPMDGGLRLPRAWRSSKERRRRLKKEARSAKCSSADSGDSGIQLETAAAAGMADSPGVRRRLRSTTDAEDASSEPRREKRPLSDISGSSIIEEIKAGLQSEVKRRSKLVRRTHSDLGSDLVRGYSRQMSQPAPITEHPASAADGRRPHHHHRLRKSLGRARGASRLRRSLSDPSVAPSPPRQRRPPPPAAGHATDDDAISESDEELLSDDESRRRPQHLVRTFEPADDSVVYAEAHWDYITLDPEELAFKAGDVIEVHDCSDRHWWFGAHQQNQGWFLAAFVRLRVSQEETVEETLDAIRSGAARPQLSRKQSVSLLSHDQVRAKVVMEILSSERAFVQDVGNVIEGYLRQVVRRRDLFTDEHVTTIFGNIEELHRFQTEFLRRLESRVDRARPHASCIGAAFVEFQHGFSIYADYCNNHPSAVSELQQLYQNNRYIHFFEACRLLRDMIDISLDGFLLTPIQKICKYPLQLAELLKYTKTDHPDYEHVRQAQAVMKAVAMGVNESKRRMESLEKLAAWQMKVEGWMGPNLLDTSSELIHQGEVTKLTSSSWSKEVCTLFLFDHVLIYCRKDLLKRSVQQFRGRINLDTAHVVDLTDGKDEFSGATVRNAIRVHSQLKNKWYVFCCKSEDEKLRWMLKFREERIRVCRDHENGFRVSDKFRRLAQIAARNHQNTPKKPKTQHPRCRRPMTLSQAELVLSDASPSPAPSQEIVKRKGTWFSFGNSKKRSRAAPHIIHQHQLV